MQGREDPPSGQHQRPGPRSTGLQVAPLSVQVQRPVAAFPLTAPAKRELRSAAAPRLLDLTDLTLVPDDPDIAAQKPHETVLAVGAARRRRRQAEIYSSDLGLVGPVTGCRVTHCLVTRSLGQVGWMRKHSKGQTVGVCLDALFWILHLVFL